MPKRMRWDPRLSAGSQILDEQHQVILELCNSLADCLEAAGGSDDARFDANFNELMVRAREHFAAEEALLAGSNYPELDDHRSEQEEFDFLAAEIITTDNFDRAELQTFLALWWSGHIVSAARKFPAYLTG